MSCPKNQQAHQTFTLQNLPILQEIHHWDRWTSSKIDPYYSAFFPLLTSNLAEILSFNFFISLCSVNNFCYENWLTNGNWNHVPVYDDEVQ